jgi:hypothetical protein
LDSRRCEGWGCHRRIGRRISTGGDDGAEVRVGGFKGDLSSMIVEKVGGGGGGGPTAGRRAGEGHRRGRITEEELLRERGHALPLSHDRSSHDRGTLRPTQDCRNMRIGKTHD